MSEHEMCDKLIAKYMDKIAALEEEVAELKKHRCPKCLGRGTLVYGNTSTWRRGLGGNMATEGICDTCWGSGRADIKGASLRESAAKDATIERLRGLLREVGDPDGGNIDEFWLTTHDGFDWMERLAAALEEEKDE